MASSNGSESSQSIQRVRVAMTGLAAVFIFIGLASAAFNYESKETPVTAIGAAKPETVANMTDTAAGNITTDEPLAELGIAPGTATADDGNAAGTAAK